MTKEEFFSMIDQARKAPTKKCPKKREKNSWVYEHRAAPLLGYWQT